MMQLQSIGIPAQPILIKVENALAYGITGLIMLVVGGPRVIHRELPEVHGKHMIHIQIHVVIAVN